MSEPFLGTVMIWAPNFAPRGWAFCQGQIMAISTNSALFSLLGVTYGGNGQTTFGLPQLAGRVPIGQGQSPGTSSYVLGETSGTESVTMTQANLPAHTHTALLSGLGVSIGATTANGTTTTPGTDKILATGVAEAGGRAGTASIYADAGTSPTTTLAPATVTGGTIQVGPTGSSIPFPVLQPYQVLNYVIALEGVFPSRN
ncbi:MAG TPA: tail fiber protein [Kaistia sp.]|jgi:microcystin-dependent protein|nr:tail fiber protein [Kaistia sp.]